MICSELYYHASQSKTYKIQCRPQQTVTPLSTIFLGKLMVTKLISKFPAFYRIFRFIAALTKSTPDPIMNQMNWVHTITSSLVFILYFSIILPHTPRPPERSFPIFWLHLCLSFPPSILHGPSLLTLLDLFTLKYLVYSTKSFLIIWSKELLATNNWTLQIGDKLFNHKESRN